MKVGHVTCDNASNNSTMMKEFAARLKITTGNKYDWKKRKIKFVVHFMLLIFITHELQLSRACNQLGDTDAYIKL